jgi:predicted nucleic acid-binding protein
VHGRAELILAGDAILLALNPLREIPILLPAGYLELEQRRCRKLS